MSSNSTECEAEPLIHAASAGNAVVPKQARAPDAQLGRVGADQVHRRGHLRPRIERREPVDQRALRVVDDLGGKRLDGITRAILGEPQQHRRLGTLHQLAFAPVFTTTGRQNAMSSARNFL